MFGHLSFQLPPAWAALCISTAAHSNLSVSQSPHQAVDHPKGRASMLPALFPAPGTVPTKVAPYILIR